jgi:hypothetical protein
LGERFGLRVHAYVPMDNHFHLLQYPRWSGRKAMAGASFATGTGIGAGMRRYGFGAGRGDCRWLSLGGWPGEWSMRPQPRR